MGKRLTLILGGARSGKSSYAEKLAAEAGGSVLYVATAEAGDEEMEQRIVAHQAQRPSSWTTLEATEQVGHAITKQPPHEVILLDCLNMLVSNVLLANEKEGAERIQTAVQAELDSLLTSYQQQNGHWIIVSNEVGLGLVPVYSLGRLFRDELGRANQHLAAAADEVLFMVAGLPMIVKGRPDGR
ncbi:MAG: bifunctional adenosylcobinamide kinase/adenosylcobinamide-phosphate guanylyltransferase [Chloroflexota bacterium]